MAQKSRIRDDKEFVRGLAQGLRTQAVRPNINGYNPHDKQVQFHSSVKKKRLFLGGNRSGKTVGGATETIWWLTGKHPYIETPTPPVRGRCVTVDFLNGLALIVKPEVARWLPSSELQGGSWDTAYDRELRILTLENGSELEFMSMDQDVDKFAGTSRNFIWFDEEPPRDIYVECLLRLVDTEGSLWMTMTPVDGMSSWVYDELYVPAKSPETDVGVTEVDMFDNPHLNHGEIDGILAGLTKEELAIRKGGKFVQISGLVYKHFDPDLHLIEPFDPPKTWMHVAAMDHGFNNPTAWLWAAISPDGVIYIYDEHYQSGEIVSHHAKTVHEYNAKHKRVPDYYVGDPSIRNTDPITGTSILLEYMEYGVPIILGNNDQKAGINRVSRYLTGLAGKPKLYVTKNCTNLIREIARLRWSTWAVKSMRSDKNKKEEQHKKDDHACDALRYLIASRPEVDDGSIVPFQPLNTRGASIATTSRDMKDEELSSGYQRAYTTDSHLGEYW